MSAMSTSTPVELTIATVDARKRPAVLTVERLCKTYGATTAVDGISFSVGHNEIVGLVGPNGAGKTTIMNIFPYKTIVIKDG